MKKIDERNKELYKQFVGFPPNSPIVRNNHPNDAFVLTVFEILFHIYHQVDSFTYENENHRELLKKFIVPPPDDSIDIFYEEKDLDEYAYHVVQVKNAELTPSEVEECFLKMDHTIKLYLKKPKEIRKNLKEIIGDTDFQQKKDCIFYLVHRGDTNYFRSQRQNQKIITEEELRILRNARPGMSVPKEVFKIDTANNFIINNFIKEDIKQKQSTKILPESILCNFNGYDLAKLNNKYSNTLIGRNILYGQNLRESLNKSSKTFDKMYETIDEEPDLFLYYNNGITILASSFDVKTDGKKENIELENFSIINGAQTTSTLGIYLREAEMHNEYEKIENLKKVYVLTKIYQINNNLQNHEIISERIKIFNNTQTPLSSRDMVSIRPEQILLQEKLKNESTPNIFVYIKKGENAPAHPKTFVHQRITNEVLAQLTLCGFFLEPFTAKDKKTKIFDVESNEKDILLNSIYDRIFHPSRGILFKKTNNEIDELLFICQIHEDAKKIQKNNLKDQLNNLNQTKAKDEKHKENLEKRIDVTRRSIEILNVCLFFNITCYFEIKNTFDYLIKDAENYHFNTSRYYDNKDDFKKSIINDFIELAYIKTIEIIRSNSGVENVNNWIRAEKNQELFIEKLRDKLSTEGYSISEAYVNFIKKYKSEY